MSALLMFLGPLVLFVVLGWGEDEPYFKVFSVVYAGLLVLGLVLAVVTA